jgi:hypothetical protein
MTNEFLFPWNEPEIESPDKPDIDLASVAPPASAEARLLERFALLAEKKSALQKELDTIKAEIDQMQPRLISFLTSFTGENLRMERVTIFLRRDLRARAKDPGDWARQDVCDALRAVGMGQYVHDAFNASDLSNWVRELEKNHKDELESGKVEDLSLLLPPKLALVLNVNPLWSVQARQRRRTAR